MIARDDAGVPQLMVDDTMIQVRDVAVRVSHPLLALPDGAIEDALAQVTAIDVIGILAPGDYARIQRDGVLPLWRDLFLSVLSVRRAAMAMRVHLGEVNDGD